MGRFAVLAGWPSRGRLLVVLVALLAMVSPLGAVSPAQAAVAKQTLSLSAPSSAEARLAFTLSGYGRPARPGRVVVVQRLSGRSWAQVGRVTESSTGRYSVRTSATGAGKLTYRAVALSWHGAAAVVSAPRVVLLHAPYILLTASTAIQAETVKVTGKLPGVYSRPVWIQRKSGTSWVTLVKAKTSRTGSYATGFKAPPVGSYSVRSLAPRVTIAGKVRAQYVTSAKTLRVVTQSATLSMPATMVQGTTAVATVKFGPVRAGRSVALQVWRAGVWTTVAAGTESGTGAASFTVIAGVPGTYSYRPWTSSSMGAPAFAGRPHALTVTGGSGSTAPGPVTAPPDITAPGPVTAPPDITAPGPVTALTATVVSDTSIRLSWTNPTASDFTGVTIRRAVGTTAPSTVISGTAVNATIKTVTSYVDTGLTAGTVYSYAVFAHDGIPNYSRATTVTATTTGGLPSISGTVTDAGGTQGLAGVVVHVSSYSLSDFTTTTTGVDGSYAFAGLPAGIDYEVCFTAADATGGSSDATGYVGQCWQNQPEGTTTPVVVTWGVTTTGINAALAVGGVVAGKITEAGGDNHGLVDVQVEVYSSSIGYWQTALSSVDGRYAAIGLPAATDYEVCFTATNATGGSSDATGYVGQCWQNQPEGTPTPVVVTSGGTQTEINAALAAGGAISGRVTDAGATPQGLANVAVSVSSPSNIEGRATTAADGSYTVLGLPAGDTYQVCFYAYGATGGSSDVPGYIDQCYDNQTRDTPTDVTVAVGATRPEINAALVAARE